MAGLAISNIALAICVIFLALSLRREYRMNKRLLDQLDKSTKVIKGFGETG
jgi:uncharacterized protein YoxC